MVMSQTNAPAFDSGLVLSALGEARDVLLSRGTPRRYDARQAIFVRGDPGDSMLLIEEGVAEVRSPRRRGGNRCSTTRRPGRSSARSRCSTAAPAAPTCGEMAGEKRLLRDGPLRSPGAFIDNGRT
jgi:CRP-like cAMP-binding protein